MTKASLTEMQAMVSTPLPLIAAAFCTKPGKCLALQVGVKAPGTANSTTFLPLKMSSVEVSFGPSGVAIISFIDGIVSPTLIVMTLLVPQIRCRCEPAAAGSGRLLAVLRAGVTRGGRGQRSTGRAHFGGAPVPWASCANHSPVHS